MADKEQNIMRTITAELYNKYLAQGPDVLARETKKFGELVDTHYDCVKATNPNATSKWVEWKVDSTIWHLYRDDPFPVIEPTKFATFGSLLRASGSATTRGHAAAFNIPKAQEARKSSTPATRNSQREESPLYGGELDDDGLPKDSVLLPKGWVKHYWNRVSGRLGKKDVKISHVVMEALGVNIEYTSHNLPPTLLRFWVTPKPGQSTTDDEVLKRVMYAQYYLSCLEEETKLHHRNHQRGPSADDFLVVWRQKYYLPPSARNVQSPPSISGQVNIGGTTTPATAPALIRSQGTSLAKATSYPQVAAGPSTAARQVPLKVEPTPHTQSTQAFLNSTLDPSQIKKRKYIKQEEVETGEDVKGEEAKRRRL